MSFWMQGVKGIILAGGKGSRLYPATQVVCKQLLPVYDKPMVYYPLATLMEMGIREILLISTPQDLPRFQALFGDGSALGISLSYQEQIEPKGIAEAFLLGETFLAGSSVALILGDNIFYGHRFLPWSSTEGARVFGYEVQDPERYGVMAFDLEGNLVAIVEKPRKPPSSYAVTGLYLYDAQVVPLAKTLKPSPRGELEITDLNNLYLAQGKLQYEILSRGSAWLDTGTSEALQQASSYIHAIEQRQGIKIGCIEEIACQQGYISLEDLKELGERLLPSEYGNYLLKLFERSSHSIKTQC